MMNRRKDPKTFYSRTLLDRLTGSMGPPAQAVPDEDFASDTINYIQRELDAMPQPREVHRQHKKA